MSANSGRLWLAVVVVAACQGRPAPPDDTAPPPTEGATGLAALPPVVADGDPVPGTGTSAVGPDTARGIVERVGAEPLGATVLRRGDGSVLALHGPGAVELVPLSGVEVMVAGSATTRSDPAAAPAGAPVFEVLWFEVRAVEGQPALDGVLEQAGAKWLLRARNGVGHALAHLPAALTALPGARVYLAGPLDRPPVGYGLIRSPPPGG